MSTALTSWVWEHAAQRGALKLLLLAMADSAGGSGRDADYQTNIPLLALMTNETEDVVRHMLVELESDGAITGFGARNRGVSAYYWLSLTRLAAAPTHRPAYQKAIIPQSLRETIFARDGWCCKHCGSTENLRVDHIYPERHGGTLALGNLQTLCQSCNSKKGARIPGEG